MYDFYTADILKYVGCERLPLWVEYVFPGKHDERLFHNHEFSEIALVLNGSAIHIIDGDEVEIHRGDLLIVLV